jgi:hypothetical protein
VLELENSYSERQTGSELVGVIQEGIRLQELRYVCKYLPRIGVYRQ